ncbi:unnamed protein product [Prorocentrum cordatum]|uniref:Uncharacterized protein n=1 Tax=Prorocentrum cordatum TaxID=2364126 RepID=A0ABN9VG47_9DINO|nr:unnamed protein product [Polarella glacialis]
MLSRLCSSSRPCLWSCSCALMACAAIYCDSLVAACVRPLGIHVPGALPSTSAALSAQSPLQGQLRGQSQRYSHSGFRVPPVLPPTSTATDAQALVGGVQGSFDGHIAQGQPEGHLGRPSEVQRHDQQSSDACIAYVRRVLKAQFDTLASELVSYGQNGSRRPAKLPEVFRGWPQRFSETGHGNLFRDALDARGDFEEQLVARFMLSGSKGRDLSVSCPWGSASAHTDGLLGGRWAPTSPSELPAHFTLDEIASLRGTHLSEDKPSDCSVDGHAQHPGDSRASSLEPLTLHWSGCDGGACKGIRGIARWMAATGLRGPLLFVGDSVTRQRHAAAVCDLRRSSCALRHRRQGRDRFPLDLRYLEVDDGGGRIWSGGLKMALYTSVRNSSVVLINIGLHGTGTVREVVELLLNASRENPSTRIVWAETTATHFENDAGYYQHQVECPHADLMRGNSTCQLPADLWCSPFDIRIFGNSIYNNETAKVFQELGADSVIPVLPIHALTQGRWDMHPETRSDAFSRVEGKNGRGDSVKFTRDCTHWIYSPAFYAPQWQMMLDVLQSTNKKGFTLSSLDCEEVPGETLRPTCRHI